MITIKEERIIRIIITPNELRKIADEMDEHWSKALPGDDITGKILYGKDIQIRFDCDQEKMENVVSNSNENFSETHQD